MLSRFFSRTREVVTLLRSIEDLEEVVRMQQRLESSIAHNQTTSMQRLVCGHRIAWWKPIKYATRWGQMGPCLSLFDT